METIRKKIREILTEHYLKDYTIQRILKMFGINPLHKLGEGSFGEAYAWGNHQALKITTDQSEAVFANGIKSQKFTHVTNVYNVNKLKGENVFIIFLEKLEPLLDEDIIWALDYMHIINDSYQNRKSKFTSFANFLDTVAGTQEDMFDYADWFNDTIHQMLREIPREKILWVQKQYEAIIRELDTHKSIKNGYTDIHAGNMGLKNGNLAVYDIEVVSFKPWRLKQIKSIA